MPANQTRWTQVELKVCPGAELWVIVRHGARSFKLPADAALGELLQGVRDGWTMSPKKARQGRRYYRIPVGSEARP